MRVCARARARRGAARATTTTALLLRAQRIVAFAAMALAAILTDGVEAGEKGVPAECVAWRVCVRVCVCVCGCV